jgi:hypothetical protein
VLYELHFYSVRSIFLQTFILIPFIVLKLFPKQISKCKKELRAITSTLIKGGLRFLCTSLLLI